MNRREFFKYALNCLTRPLEKFIPKRRQRPPGALVDDQKFQEKCTGCDACMVACPVNAILIEDMEKRLPVIFPDENACVLCEEMPCINACRAGALQLLHPGEEEHISD